MSQEKVESILKECREKLVQEPESVKEILLKLSPGSAEDRQLCRDLWMGLLDGKADKKVLMSWQSDVQFSEHLRAIFCS